MANETRLYGRQSRARLQGYRKISYATHARDYVRAANGRGRGTMRCSSRSTRMGR